MGVLVGMQEATGPWRCLYRLISSGRRQENHPITSGNYMLYSIGQLSCVCPSSLWNPPPPSQKKNWLVTAGWSLYFAKKYILSTEMGKPSSYICSSVPTAPTHPKIVPRNPQKTPETEHPNVPNLNPPQKKTQEPQCPEGPNLKSLKSKSPRS